MAFYCTPISTQTPYEQLARHADLPPNLHVQKEPIRFHPGKILHLIISEIFFSNLVNNVSPDI